MESPEPLPRQSPNLPTIWNRVKNGAIETSWKPRRRNEEWQLGTNNSHEKKDHFSQQCHYEVVTRFYAFAAPGSTSRRPKPFDVHRSRMYLATNMRWNICRQTASPIEHIFVGVGVMFMKRKSKQFLGIAPGYSAGYLQQQDEKKRITN